MKKDIIITEMTIQDLLSIKDILETDFDDFWSSSVFKSELENINSNLFVAKINGKIVGFVSIWHILDEFHITNIVTRKSNRNTGIGSYLLQTAITYALNNKATSITLEVNIKNASAIHLYSKFDFKEVGLRKKYYNGTDDALIMTKNLNT